MTAPKRKISVRKLCAKAPEYFGISFPLNRRKRSAVVFRRVLGPVQRWEIVHRLPSGA